jgi:hypothetical protein
MSQIDAFLDSDAVFTVVFLTCLVIAFVAAISLAQVLRGATPEARQKTWINPANVVFYPSLLNEAGRRARRRFLVCAILAVAVPWLYLGFGSMLGP